MLKWKWKSKLQNCTNVEARAVRKDTLVRSPAPPQPWFAALLTRRKRSSWNQSFSSIFFLRKGFVWKYIFVQYACVSKCTSVSEHIPKASVISSPFCHSCSVFTTISSIETFVCLQARGRWTWCLSRSWTRTSASCRRCPASRCPAAVSWSWAMLETASCLWGDLAFY